MNKKIELPKEPTLEEAVEAFSIWRKTRNVRTKIPQYLWDTAISLTNKHSINHLSKTLNLGHTDLKKRTQSIQSSKDKASFIELDISKPFIEKSSVMEFTKPDGYKMRLEIPYETSLVLELCKTFMGNNR